MAAAKEKQMVFTAKLVEEMTNKLNDGVILKRYENPWMKSEIGIRRAGVTYAFTEHEIEEYVKCSQDIHYFTEKYCKVKTEDGSIGAIKLRDYQKDIMDNFVSNRFNILMASRQVGKCSSLETNVTCQIVDKNGEVSQQEIPLYKLLFICKSRRTVVDYIRYVIYFIIGLLS